MEIFNYTDYRKYIRDRIKASTKHGYGQLRKIAEKLSVSSALLSQVLNGSRNFSEDQAFTLCEYFELSNSESTFFILLVQKDRASTVKLKNHFERQLEAIRLESAKLSSKIQPDHLLAPEKQAVFYSSWLYAAVQTLASIEQFRDLDSITNRLGTSRVKVKEALDWLVANGFCKIADGKIMTGPVTTFIDRESLLASRHHMNWRAKGIEAMGKFSKSDFFFSAPFSCSKESYTEFRKKLLVLIEELAKDVKKGKPELMATINIDLFET